MTSPEVQVRRALVRDATLLAPRLRQADAREIEAVTSLSHEATLAAGVGAPGPATPLSRRGTTPLEYSACDPRAETLEGCGSSGRRISSRARCCSFEGAAGG